jgi:hypothetical protein
MYPYNFRPNYSGIDHKKIFVVMPFDKKYDKVLAELIIPATKEANRILRHKKSLRLSPYRTKDDLKTQSGWINVLENLNTAQIVLGVLSGANPNVFYELGISYAKDCGLIYYRLVKDSDTLAFITAGIA